MSKSKSNSAVIVAPVPQEGASSNLRSSARLRNNSSKDNKDPNFIYDPLGRSISWSDLSPAVKKTGSRKKRVLNKLYNSESNIVEAVTDCFKEPSVKAVAWKNKQIKYSQKRIDILLRKEPSTELTTPAAPNLLRTET